MGPELYCDCFVHNSADRTQSKCSRCFESQHKAALESMISACDV